MHTGMDLVDNTCHIVGWVLPTLLRMGDLKLSTSLVAQNNLIAEVIRSASPLSVSFVTSSIMNIQGANQVQLLVSFVKGNSDGCRLKLEYSEDKVDWYQESMINEFIANDAKHALLTRVISNSGNYVISVPVSGSFFRVSAQAITSGTNTSLSILATKANI